MKKSAILLFILLNLFSCQKFTKMIDSDYGDKLQIKTGSDHIKIIFSHNINGETHPCGCRKFPLGGLPQVAGYMHKAAGESSIIYVDTGDMLFQTPTLPPYYQESMTFTANKLAQVQDQLNLKFFVPGELDLALGEKYLADLSEKHKFKFLVSNLKENSEIKHKKWDSFQVSDRTLYFIGIVNPSIISEENKNLFTPPAKALKEVLNEIKTDNKKNPTIILLSHGGMDFDKNIANQFPEINWIIGSHSQAFLRDPEIENKTKIVQVLSRNHYLGVIKVPLNKDKEISYEQVEVREGLEKEYPNNPIDKWLSEYKSELDKLQANEQKTVGSDKPIELKANTYLDCMNCHQSQVESWKKTSHAIAFQTLIQNQASNNPQCIKCHSLLFNDARGFSTKDDIIQGHNLKDIDHEKYWNELKTEFKGVKSIRSLSSDQRHKKAQAWHKLDKKYELDFNYANVQCLNCHNQSATHVFDDNPLPKVKDYSTGCIECHTRDQSPEWYEESEQGLATVLKKDYVEQKIKEIACPKNM